MYLCNYAPLNTSSATLHNIKYHYLQANNLRLDFAGDFKENSFIIYCLYAVENKNKVNLKAFIVI